MRTNISPSGRKYCADTGCVLSEALLSLPSTYEPPPISKRSYQAKTVLFHQGTPATHVFMLRKGYVKLSVCLPDGRVQGLQLIQAGQFIGIDALSNPCYPYMAEAMTAVSVCMFHRGDFRRLLTESSDISLRVLAALGQELRQANESICRLGVMNAMERVAACLLMLCPADVRAEKKLPLPLSRKDMAEMLGLTVETVSRVISKLISDRIIEAPPGGGYFRVLDKSGLFARSGTRGWVEEGLAVEA